MSDPGTSNGSGEATPRWPRTVGAIGLVVGAIMVLDQVDELLLPLFWDTGGWRRLVGGEVADLLMRSMPPRVWVVAASLVKMALGVLLMVGSLRLRRLRRSGVTLCRAWAGLAIAWLAVEMGWAVVWFSHHAGEIPGLPAQGWQSAATCGVALALVLLLAWPVCLLVWFAKPEVREEIAGWPL